MTQGSATRRDFIGTAAKGAVTLVPLAVLSACGGADSGSSMLGLLTGKTADARPEPEIWKSAVGQSFRASDAKGTVYGTLTSVVPQPEGNNRPDELRQQPLLVTFTLDRGYDTVGDDIYWLDRTMGTENRLFMQRGVDAGGRVVLSALLN